MAKNKTLLIACACTVIVAFASFIFKGDKSATSQKDLATLEPIDKPTLVVGIENGYFPYEYYDESGKFVGYDVDVITYVCEKLQKECILDKGAFDSLISNLLYRKTDLVISALSITDERKKRVDFSDSYVPAQRAIWLVNDKSPAQQSGDLKVVGVQQGTTLAAYLKEKTDLQIKYYPSFDQSVIDLKAGRVDAVFESIDVAKGYYQDATHNVRILNEQVSDPLISQGTGIAFRPGDALVPKVNAILKEAEESGFLPALRQKYGIE